MRKRIEITYIRREETGEAGARLAQDDQPNNDHDTATRREQERVDAERRKLQQQGFAAHISRR